jgi:alpha-galactosidase
MMLLVLFIVFGVQSAAAEKPQLARTPVLGWNSWNHFGCNVSESLIKETADALVSSGLAAAGYNYINLDDCWQASFRDEHNRIAADPEKFPSGMKSLADYIHSKGLKFGVYSSAGFKTCQAFPASLGLEALDAASYAEWGVDYLKYDNCYTDHSSPQQRFPPMAKALQASGKDILFSLCEWGRENPAVWAGEYGHSWRSCMDISDHWKSIVKNTAMNTPLWRFAGPGSWNDPDMLEVGNGGCSAEEYKAHFSLWAAMKSPLIIGNDVRNMQTDGDAYGILTNAEVIAVNQDPLGLQARRIWSDRLDTENPEARLVATKCAVADGGYQDDPQDQQWSYNAEDGTIRSAVSGKCLHEVPADEAEELAARESEGLDPELRELEWVPRGSEHLLDVSTRSCDDPMVTKWDVQGHSGGTIQSRSSGKCLEVSNFEFVAGVTGKRVQTANCRAVVDELYRTVVDIREHQQWVSVDGQLVNLHQRQCLTINRDAPLGSSTEIYKVPVSTTTTGEPDKDNSTVVVLVWNKASEKQKLDITWDMLGLETGQRYHVYDLWLHTEAPFMIKDSITMSIPAHGVLMLKMTPKDE